MAHAAAVWYSVDRAALSPLSVCSKYKGADLSSLLYNGGRICIMGSRQLRQATVTLERTDRSRNAQEMTTGGARMLKGEDGVESTKLRTIWTGTGLCGSASVGRRTVHRTSGVHA